MNKLKFSSRWWAIVNLCKCCKLANSFSINAERLCASFCSIQIVHSSRSSNCNSVESFCFGILTKSLPSSWLSFRFVYCMSTSKMFCNLAIEKNTKMFSLNSENIFKFEQKVLRLKLLLKSTNLNSFIFFALFTLKLRPFLTNALWARLTQITIWESRVILSQTKTFINRDIFSWQMLEDGFENQTLRTSPTR